MERLQQTLGAARLRPGEALLDVGTSVGVLIPLIKPYRPAVISGCDLTERMQQRLSKRPPTTPRPAEQFPVRQHSFFMRRRSNH
jgi:cyclopropane fatty-acyl-phospholipid synthase-like methyltransferase